MRKVWSWLVGVVLLGRAVALLLPVAATFVVVTALLGGVVEDPRARVALGLTVALALPLLLRWRLGEFLRTRRRPVRPPAWGTFVAASNVVLAGGLAFGFADDVGRSLRRHGDWFCGESNGLVVRGVRSGVAV